MWNTKQPSLSGFLNKAFKQAFSPKLPTLQFTQVNHQSNRNLNVVNCSSFQPKLITGFFLQILFWQAFLNFTKNEFHQLEVLLKLRWPGCVIIILYIVKWSYFLSKIFRYQAFPHTLNVLQFFSEFLNVLEYVWIFLNILEHSWIFLNILEYSWIF